MIYRDGTPTKERYLHHMRDTLILLGLDAGLDMWLIDLIVDPSRAEDADADALRNFNAKLINTTKDKLVNINRLSIQTDGE